MSIDLFDCVDLSEGAVAGQQRVDRDKGVIRHVKVLGWKSLNGRSYDPEGVDPRKYDLRPVNLDHVKTGQEGSVRDTVGWLEGLHKRPDGLYAERLCLLHPSGDFEQKLMTAAESAPHLFGLSHSARGRQRPGRGPAIIDAVEEVKSVDLVREPATVSSLYESRFTVKKTVSDLCESLKTTRPGYARALHEMAQSGILSSGQMMDDPGMDPVAGDEGADHKAAILDACKACIDDASLDVAGKIAKIKKLLSIHEDEKPASPPPSEDEPDEEDEDEKEESVKKQKEENTLKEENARLKTRAMLRDLADEAGVKVTKALLESVRTDITEAEVKALLADLKGDTQTRRSTPRSAAPYREEKPAGTAVTESKGTTPALTDEARKTRLGKLRSQR